MNNNVDSTCRPRHNQYVLNLLKNRNVNSQSIAPDLSSPHNLPQKDSFESHTHVKTIKKYNFENPSGNINDILTEEDSITHGFHTFHFEKNQKVDFKKD